MPRNWSNRYSFRIMEQNVYVREYVETEIRKRTEAYIDCLTISIYLSLNIWVLMFNHQYIDEFG